MAYCAKCGAYIPDGRKVCVACGKPVNAQTQAAYAEPPREEKKPEQKPNTEKQRTTAEKLKDIGEKAEQYIYEGEEKLKDAGVDRSRLFSALSYVSFLCFLPYMFCAGDEFARFHAKQGLILFVCSCVIDLIGFIAPLMWLLRLCATLMMIIGIFNAVTGKKKKLPFIGNLF